MNISKLFIQRPVATTMLILALVIGGLAAYFNLAISELPNVDFPTLVVSADLPGADPQTMASSVATPLEKALSTVSGIDSMSSVSNAGSTKITIQFELSRNIDSAAQDVQSALLQAQRKLPSQMPNPPSIKKVNPADSPILYLALVAPNLSMTKLDDYAENYLSLNLSTLPGVASVNVFGSQQYAVRIQLNPALMKSRGLGFSDVSQAINKINSNQATGTLQTEGSYHLITVDGGLNNAKEFSKAIISNQNGAPIRLNDIATVKNSVANDKAVTWYNNQKSIVLAIARQPGSNTVAVANNILKQIPQLEKQLPGGATLKVVYNRATFIKSAINDVEYTLIFAVFLVVSVIYLFFRNFRITTIAALSLPVSVIATFGLMYLLSFSLDNLSLMALVLAVGFVVDDAIVVLENIIRYVEQGMDKLTASFVGSKEVGFTVISMTLSLVAVFIPIFFMGGIIGRLFHEFAAVVGIAILLSAVVALTLIPMLCSRFIKHEGANEAASKSGFNRFFEKCRSWYTDSLKWSLEHVKIILLIAGGIIVCTVFLFHSVPKDFIPSEDTGMIIGSVEAPEGITYNNFIKEQNLVKAIIEKNPDVSDVISSVGQAADASASTNTGRLIIKLKPASDRALSADQIIQQIKKKTSQVAGLKIFLTNPPAISIGGKSSNSNYQYVLQSVSWASLENASNVLQKKLSTIPGIEAVDSDLQMNNPELSLHILRDKAAVLGVTPSDIESTLYSAYGQQQVSTIQRADGDYNVIMEVDPKYQHSTNSLNSLYLKSSSGSMVPLSDVVNVTQTAGPLSINHFSQLPAVTISFNLAPNYSLGDIVSKVQAAAKEVLPSDVTGSFTGSAQKFQQSLVTLPVLLIFTILIIYMLLGVLYENFIHPLTILTALPFAVFGALLCLYIFGQPLDIFSFIGLIVLVGITKKNGIIMIDFAVKAQRTEGLTAKEAILQACSIRFRPIMMTTVSAIVAALPLALGLGAGGATRQGMGIAVVGGLIFSQLITLYITPVFYVLMDKLSSSKIKKETARCLPALGSEQDQLK